MAKFEVGDIVRSKTDENGHEYYGVTTSDIRCKVVHIGDGGNAGYIWVVAIERLHTKTEFQVLAERFRHEYNRSE